MERAAVLIAVSSSSECSDEQAQELYQRAIDLMVDAAHSPFLGGTETAVSDDGLAVVREMVFDRVSDELKKRGYQI